VRLRKHLFGYFTQPRPSDQGWLPLPFILRDRSQPRSELAHAPADQSGTAHRVRWFACTTVGCLPSGH